MSAFTESVVEDAALEWFGELGYRVLHGPEIAPGEPAAERASYEQVVLEGQLREALATLNPGVPQEGLEEAFRKLTRISSPQLVDANPLSANDSETVRRNVTIDGTVKESVRAKLRVIVRRILRKYGYPPDKQEAATNTVLQQVELLADFWAEGSTDA